MTQRSRDTVTSSRAKCNMIKIYFKHFIESSEIFKVTTEISKFL